MNYSILHYHAPLAIFLMGSTASGKTALAMKLHKQLPVDIISVDSALIYRGMDIGTAKPNSEELAEVPHRLINIRDPVHSYSVAEFCRDALYEMHKITARNRIPLLVGGSMLYFKALLYGLSPLPPANPEIRAYIERKAKIQGWGSLYQKLNKIDPTSANRIHPNDLRRILRALEVFFVSGRTVTELTKISSQALKYRVHQFAIVPFERSILNKCIKHRFYKMLNSGFEKEVDMLFSCNAIHRDMPSICCVGYRQMWKYLSNEINYDEMVLRAIYATQKLAKHQITWLRRWEKLNWLDNNQSSALDKILKIIRT